MCGADLEMRHLRLLLCISLLLLSTQAGLPDTNQSGGYSLDIQMEEYGSVPVLWVADKENTKFKKQPDENAILKAAQLYLGKQRGMSRCTVSWSAERLKTAIWPEWIVQFGCPPSK